MMDARDEQVGHQYARADIDPASAAGSTAEWRGADTEPSRRFVIFIGGALVAILVPTFISFGMWQWNKAAAKETRQALLDTREKEPPVLLSAQAVDAESMRFRRVSVRGHYEPGHQILIDNRVHQQHAGYHVITPLRIDGSEMRVLVNRGWISANASRQIPQVPTPTETVELQATAVMPGTRFFTLAPEPAGNAWQPVWQNLDFARYRQAVDFPLQPVVLQLDPESAGGGFIRDWPRPDERIERHVGYAWQWFGFAAATVGIWLYFLLRPRFSRK
jgi:surfeit locus 1 family protein